MRAQLLLTFALVASVVATSGQAHALPDGGYIGIGLGGAIASGDRGVALKPSPTVQVNASSAGYDEVVRTDFGTGLAVELRFGYLIAKVLGVEIGVSGHGATSFDEGAGYPTFALRYHFIQHAIDLAERDWDVDVYFGGGYAIGGYHPSKSADPSGDGKGWEGWQVSFGFNGEYQIGERVGLALDLKFVLPQYGSFVFNYDKDYRADPASTPSTLVVMPTLQVVFHL